MYGWFANAFVALSLSNNLSGFTLFAIIHLPVIVKFTFAFGTISHPFLTHLPICSICKLNFANQKFKIEFTFVSDVLL